MKTNIILILNFTFRDLFLFKSNCWKMLKLWTALNHLQLWMTWKCTRKIIKKFRRKKNLLLAGSKVEKNKRPVENGGIACLWLYVRCIFLNIILKIIMISICNRHIKLLIINVFGWCFFFVLLFFHILHAQL